MRSGSLAGGADGEDIEQRKMGKNFHCKKKRLQNGARVGNETSAGRLDGRKAERWIKSTGWLKDGVCDQRVGGQTYDGCEQGGGERYLWRELG